MVRAVAWWFVLAGLWLALIDNHHLDELVAGLAATLAGAAVAVVAFDRMSPGVRVPLRALAVAPRVAWRMLLDTGLLLRALWQTVVLRRPVRGRWVSEPIDAADTPAARGRRVFTVLAGSATPNRVVGDAEGGRLLVHQLVSADEPLDPLASR
jgi:Na+/H+ ion antiporter subunit